MNRPGDEDARVELRFSTVVLWTGDVERITTFYESVLGFRLSDRAGDGERYRSGETWAEMHAQHVAPEEPEIEFLDQTVHVMPPRPRESRLGCILAFLTDDIIVAVGRLERGGATRTSEVIEESWGWYCYFTDPDGNDLELFQYRGEPWSGTTGSSSS